MRQKNKGFTLVEMVITVAIFAILLGILVPSLNSILGFRVQRAANSIASALDKTKIEASNRLVGEMKLEKLEDGYYITYYLDRGKVEGESNVQEDQAEKIAPAKTLISYTTSDGDTHQMQPGDSIVLTYDRATGDFFHFRRVSGHRKKFWHNWQQAMIFHLQEPEITVHQLLCRVVEGLRPSVWILILENIQSHQAGLQNSTMKRGRAFDENKRKSMEIKE